MMLELSTTQNSGIMTQKYEEQAKMYLQWLRENPKEMNSSKLVGKIIDLHIQLVVHQ